jgi:hypothetical protein
VIPAYFVMVRDLRERKIYLAILHMLAWALAIAVTVEWLASRAPEPGAASVIHGVEYRGEMLHWIRTGIGRESDPAEFLPEHLLHLSVFVVLSLVSGSLLSLALGAVLMNYMSYYLGGLLALAQRPATILVYGWPPWAIFRVAAYILLGVALSGPMLRRVAGIPFRWEERRGLLLAAAAGLLLDVILKSLLAPTWCEILRSALFPLAPGL